ncbi:MAG TPA: sulfotransferase family protein [Thermoanaerobaculia bacterium]
MCAARAYDSSETGGDARPEPLRICLWSGPRCFSTAVLYAFAQRRDTRALDEPLYGHYLRVSGSPHPGRDVVLAAMEQDGRRVVEEVILGPVDRPVLFCKQMAHHLRDLDWEFLRHTANVLLIRDPRQLLPSLAKRLARPALADTGLALQTRLLATLEEWGQVPPVLDARELLLDPEAVLRTLCNRLGIGFDPAMLSWPPGPKACDGVWAPYWYDGVHRTSSFEPYRERTAPLPEALAPVLAECAPHYERLRALAITAAPRASAAPAGAAE